MAEDIKLSKAEIEELRSLIRLLREDMDSAQFENLLKSGPAAKRVLNDLRKEATEFTSDISGTLDSFRLLINQIKGTKSGVNQVVNAFKGIYKVSEDILYAQRDITNLTEKDIAKLEEKMAMKKVDLENADRILKAEQKSYEQEKKYNEDLLSFYKTEKEKLDKKTIWTEKDLRYHEKLKKLEKDTENHLDVVKKKLNDNKGYQNDIKGILSEQDGHYNTLTATIATINRQLEDQKKLLGLGGAIVGSLDAALGQLGLGRLAGALGISEASTEMNEFAKKIVKDRETQLILEREISDEMKARAKGEGKLSPEVLAEKYKQLNALKDQNAQYDGINGKLAVLKKGISSMGASLVKNLTDPLALTVGFVTQLFSALKSADQATGELAKQFGTSYKEASNIRQELNSTANSSFDLNVTTKGLQESLVAVGQALGSNAKLNEADLVTMTKLTKQAGYTHDELMGIQKLSLMNGKTLEDNTKEVLGSAKAHAATRGLMINEREVLKEVNKMSASLKLSLGGSASKMAEAVVKAKEFGLNIEQAEKMAEGLLQFESSISSELEAEMLTGKALNFEKARLLALNNDVAGAAAEIAKQVGSSADFTKMNRIQQEALAKAAGMTRDELAQSLMDKEALAKLSAKEGETAKQAFDRLVQEVGMEEAKKRLGNEELAKQYESQSVQEKFNATIEKLKEIFISLADPIMEMANHLTFVFKIIGGIASGIGVVINVLNKVTGGLLPAFIGGLIAIKLLTGSIGAGLLKAVVAPFKLAKEGLSTLGKGISKLIPEGKGGILGKIKDKFGGSKTDDLADKAKDKADKTSSAAKGGDNAKGFADRMKNIAKGIAAFGNKEVLFGALNLIPTSIGLIAMLPGFLGAKAIEKLDGKKLKSSLEGLAKGIEAFGSGKVTGGAANLIAASIGLITMLPGVLGALAIQSIDGKAVKKSLEGLAGGLEAMANGKAALGALALIPASLGLIAMIPGFLGVKLIEKIDGKGVKKGLEGLADGLEAMAKGKVLLGAGALAVASIGLTAAIPGMIAAAVLGSMGPLVGKGLKAFASGIESLATGKVFLGAAALAVLGLALIPAAIAFKQFSEVSWEDMGKAGVALLGLGVAGAAFGSILPLMLAGAVAIAALGASLLPLAFSLNLAAPALDQFSEALSKIDGEKLFSAAAGIGALGLAMAAFGAGSLISGIGSAIGELFGSDPTEKFNKLASIDGERLKVTADSISTLGTAINNLDANKLGEVGDGFEKLSDSLNKSLLGSAIGELVGAESPISNMVSQLNELGSFDSTKILTIAEAITKLSESVDNLNSVTANMGDVSPIVTTIDKVVELHDSFTQNPLEKVVNKVSEGVSDLFSKAFEFVSSTESPTSSDIQPSETNLIPSNTSDTSNKTSSLGAPSQSITSNDNVVKILQEAVIVLKAIQAKNTNVELSIDGDVVARKITPNVSREQVRTYSNVG